jgi:hypothetical protein
MYFESVPRHIPMLMRDCAFEWGFPKFEARAWILFEVAENFLNHSKFGATGDILPFISHVQEMIKCRVSPVMDKYGYKRTN